MLQAIAIPRWSYKKNLEEAQQQFESKFLFKIVYYTSVVHQTPYTRYKQVSFYRYHVPPVTYIG